MLTRFVDCHILRTDALPAFSAADQDALDRLVCQRLPAIGPVHAAVRKGLDRMRRE